MKLLVYKDNTLETLGNQSTLAIVNASNSFAFQWLGLLGSGAIRRKQQMVENILLKFNV